MSSFQTWHEQFSDMTLSENLTGSVFSHLLFVSLFVGRCANFKYLLVIHCELRPLSAEDLKRNDEFENIPAGRGRSFLILYIYVFCTVTKS